MDLYTLDCQQRTMREKQTNKKNRALAVFQDRPHPVCPFGMAD